jgi:hypothetical protein
MSISRLRVKHMHPRSHVRRAPKWIIVSRSLLIKRQQRTLWREAGERVEDTGAHGGVVDAGKDGVVIGAHVRQVNRTSDDVVGHAVVRRRQERAGHEQMHRQQEVDQPILFQTRHADGLRAEDTLTVSHTECYRLARDVLHDPIQERQGLGAGRAIGGVS